MILRRSAACSLLCTALFALPALAQRVYTDQDYANAERWMNYNADPLVLHTVSHPDYLSDGRIFYADPVAGSRLYMLADPAHATQAPAFDNAKLAAALKAASKRDFTADHLNITSYAAEANGGFAVGTAAGTFHCTAEAATCTAEPVPPSTTPAAKPGTPAPPPGRRAHGEFNLSPDKKLAVFIRDNNLWLRTVATGQERQLTTDGQPDFGYATDNAGWQHSDSAIVTWSADSKMLATFQQDQRKTGLMYLVPTTNRHPKLEAWRYPLVGDKDVTMIEPVVIDVATGKLTRLQTPPLQHRSMECDDVSCSGGRWTDVDFSPDDSQLAFVSTSRDHKDETVEVANTTTGTVRKVYHEHVDTYYGWQAATDWKVLWASHEFLWVSERSDTAQLYLYSLTTGKLKGQVTHGDGPVYDLLHVDDKARVAYFIATGKTPGVHPYYQQLFRVDLDGTHQQLLTPEPEYHQVTASPDGSTFLDIYSTVDQPQTAVVRDDNGHVLMTLQHQDISALLAKGWKPPVPITVKARDGHTPLYGYMELPTNFDPTQKYPVIDYVYPGPQDAACTLMGWGFSPARGDTQALADLGFAVLCIDGMGNPHRTKSFHDAHASSPADMGEDTIPDQVSGIQDLATQHPYLDLSRVGIWGHSGGGNATASAMFHFPEFFKVGWAESGNHDQRNYEDDWDERWAGLEVLGPNGQDNYSAQANENYAANLKGHLMLVHGTMDDNVPPNNTLLVVDALIKANKSFDLLMIPNAHHGYAVAGPYVTRRRWDYFVQYLAGGTPPEDYKLLPYDEVMKKLYGPQP